MMRQLSLLLSGVAAALILVLAALGSAQAEPKERPSNRDKLEDLRQELSSLREDFEDVYEPVEEFDIFDQCMFTVGVTQYGSKDNSFGYVFGATGRERRQALAMDMRGFDPPQYDLMAFPGEEPPQIECNEDAGGEFTDE